VLPEDAPKSAKPRTSSLFKTMSLETLTLDDALRLLTLPRVVGTDPESGDEITAQNGRYGPYLRKGSDSRSIDEEEKLLTITLEEALAIYAQPKTRGRAAANPGRELGDDPATGKKVTVKSGRFGPYVTDGEYNATLRQGDDEATVSLERAAELLAEKRAKGPAPKKRGAKKTAKKSTAKKTAAKKTTAKKTTAKKST
jgi:DNA topoisomerase-1